jgi:hypothetical protein
VTGKHQEPRVGFITLRRPDSGIDEQALGTIRQRDVSGMVVRLHRHPHAALQTDQYLLAVPMRVAAAHNAFWHLVNHERPAHGKRQFCVIDFDQPASSFGNSAQRDQTDAAGKWGKTLIRTGRAHWQSKKYLKQPSQ